MPSTTVRRVAAGLLIVCALLGGLWWYRFALLTWLGHALLANTQLTDAGFSGLTVSRTMASVDHLRFGLMTRQGALSAELDGVRAAFDLDRRRLTTITIAAATLTFDYEPPQQAADTDDRSQGFALPFERLQVDQLALAVATPWGRSTLAGSVDITQSNDALKAHLAGDGGRLAFAADGGFTAGSVTLDDSRNQRIVTIDINGWQSPKPALTLSAPPGALMDWLGSTAWIPSSLKTTIVPTDSSTIQPLLSSLQLKLTAETDADFARWHGWLLITQQGDYLTSADLTADIDRRLFVVDAHLDMPAERLFDTAKPWLPQALAPWQVSQGRVVATSRWRWQHGVVTVNTANIRAYDGVVASADQRIGGLDLELDADDIVNLKGNLAATAETLAFGENTVLTDARLKLNAHGRKVNVEQAQLRLFGGQLALEPGELDYRHLPLVVNLLVDDLDLSQLLSSLNYPPLSGTGRISGKLPLSASLKGVEIHDGRLSGGQPGVLRYQTPENPGDNLALKALRNLMYHSLQASLDYQPDGAYKLGLRMQGKNPNVLSGHPLAFNLNVSGQLPELMRKGMLAGGFERSVLERAAANPIEPESPESTTPPPGEHKLKPPSPAERRP